MQEQTLPRPERPSGINHLVLNVRDIEESHRFWTEILGFQHVGSLRPRGGQEAPQRRMRFYSADHNGQLSHHDIALIERPALWTHDAVSPPVSPPMSLMDHVAIAMPDRDSWLRQLEYMQSRGIEITARFKRGISESVHVSDPNGHDIEILYERPRALWERDIEIALNTGERMASDQAAFKAPADATGGDHAATQ